jgi:hypothetical protein
MKGGVFNTTKQCKISFILHAFYENRLIEWNLHVDFTSLPQCYQCYDLIVGHDLMSELQIIINFNDKMMTWDESTIKMRDYGMFLDTLSPINDFYWYKEILESQVLNEASSHLNKILDTKYEPADLDKIVQECEYITVNEQMQSLSLLYKHEHLFDGSLGIWHNEPYNIELKSGAKPFHSRPFPVSKIHETTLLK